MPLYYRHTRHTEQINCHCLSVIDGALDRQSKLIVTVLLSSMGASVKHRSRTSRALAPNRR